MDVHVPVLLAPVLEFLSIKPDGTYIDCTGGLGGHSAEILKRLSPSGQLYICDYHAPTLQNLKKRFAEFANVTVVSARFSQVFEKCDFLFDGILADFGISSPQLVDASLGIGFDLDKVPLDMRIDDTLSESAADLLATRSAEELADIFFNFGGERMSRKIAAAIVYDRELGKVYDTTDGLRGLCERVLGKFYRGKKISPATKVFQGLRIAVNKELEEIATFVKIAPTKLKSGGRLVTIAFHEGEDRLVKVAFKSLVQSPKAQTSEYFLPEKKSVAPDKEEIAANPRARSAKLRVLERV